MTIRDAPLPGSIMPMPPIGTRGAIPGLLEPGANSELRAYRQALLTLRDTHALRLASLRPGTSAYKTAAGYLRGIQDALGALGHE